jgi:mono/diheme cytochrome c family protein
VNYPVWYLPGIGGGFLIALIAVTHVFVSHFAVGGGLYLVLTERKGLRENSPGILAFTKRHTKFFMLLTMVFGGITGVGIWFIISLAHPAATSLLIHTFVYGWAAEWVCFLVEITALLVYYYTFGKMDSRTHQIVGWIYFIAAWLSLFLINGIIDFMLTPGAWLENHNFWSGFFNPSFWPSLLFRSFFSFMLAGLYAFLTSAFLKDPDLKARMTRYSGKWALSSFLLALPCGYWYLTILPDLPRQLIAGSSPTIQTVAQYALYATIVTFALILLLTVIRPAFNNKAVAILTMIPAFILLGAFEWTREAARRPYVINQVMFSHGIAVAQAEELQGQGFLDRARWTAIDEATEDNLTAAGQELFKLQCYACHTIGGINNDIVPKTAAMDFPALTNYLRNVIHKRPYMPPFFGSELEAAALAAYIAGDLHGKPVDLAMLAPPAVRGQKLYDDNCSGCHDLDAATRWAEKLSVAEIATGLASLSKLNEAMEDFAGSAEDKLALAGFLKGGGTSASLDGRSILEQSCTGCHGQDVVMAWAEGKSAKVIDTALANPGGLNQMMEGLTLSEQERLALAGWLSAAKKGGGR